MYFEVIDLQTGKCADAEDIANEKWAYGVGGDEEGGFMIDQDFALCLVDELGNYAYCPRGRFKIIMYIDNCKHSFIY